jgi:hypothetical protein
MIQSMKSADDPVGPVGKSKWSLTTRASWILLGTVVACSGTEGGNPLDGHDAGPGPSDAATCSASDATSFDGDPVLPELVCERGEDTSEACTCFVGEAAAFSEIGEGGGQHTALLGPTSSGGFAAVHQRVCIEDCSDDARATLEVHRFDAAGAPVGAPIEVSRSSAWVQQGAVLEGDALTLVFADERDGESAPPSLYFARLDLASGSWIEEPRVVLVDAADPGAVMGVELASTGTGYGVVMSRTAPPSAAGAGAFFFALNEDGARVGDVVRVAGAEREYSGTRALVRRGDGFWFGRWTAGSLVLVPLTAEGEEGAAVEIASATAEPIQLIVRPSAEGNLVVWSDATGLRFVRTNAEGAPIGEPVEVADGTLRAMVEQRDGHVALLWLARRHACGGAFVDGQEWIVTRFDRSGARVDDVLVHRGTGNSFGGDLVETRGGLRASIATYGPERSTAWTMPTCVR